MITITILESFMLGVLFVLDLCLIKYFLMWVTAIRD